MALTMKFFSNGVDAIANAAVDWDTDTIKASLHTATYTPNQSTDNFFDDCTNELATASGYTAGGITLASKTRATSALVTTLDAADITWNFSGSVTFRYLVIRKARGGAASADEVIGYGDFGSNQTVSTDFTVTWNASGIFTVTSS